MQTKKLTALAVSFSSKHYFVFLTIRVIWWPAGLNTTFRICLGISAKDISTDYRMYHTEQLKAVSLTCSNYDVLQEVLLKIKLHNPDRKLRI